MQSSEEKLKASLLEIMEAEEAELEEEMKNVEPHKFSETFEKKMEALLKP